MMTLGGNMFYTQPYFVSKHHQAGLIQCSYDIFENYIFMYFYKSSKVML